MRIAVNCRFLIKNKLEGIGNYSLETTRRLVESHPEHHFILIFDRAYDESFVFGDNCTPVVVSPPARHPVLWYIWFEWRLPSVLRRHKADVLYSPDSYLSCRSRVPTALIVHDLAYLHYPDSIPGVVLRFYKRWFPRYFRRAQSIGTVSHYTAQDLKRQYPDIDLDAKLHYTPCAADKDFRPRSFEEQEALRAEFTCGHEFFLFVGAIHPRKNVITLLKAFFKFKQFYASNMKLVLVGRLAWMTDEFDSYLSEHPYREDIVLLQDLQRPRLKELFGAAYALVYPSYFEGFGMPILESIQSGVPVIVSDSSSMPEVAGDAGILVDPDSADDVSRKMGELYKNEALYQQLKNACPDQAAKFDWNKTSDTIYEMIRKAKESGVTT